MQEFTLEHILVHTSTSTYVILNNYQKKYFRLHIASSENNNSQFLYFTLVKAKLRKKLHKKSTLLIMNISIPLIPHENIKKKERKNPPPTLARAVLK